MKLTGWHRIGIVLSTMWCVFIIGLTIYHYNFPPKHMSFLIAFEDDITKPIKMAPRIEAPCARGYNCPGDPGYNEPQEPKVTYKQKTVVNYIGVLVSIIVPIAVMLFLIISVKWVVKGFKSDP